MLPPPALKASNHLGQGTTIQLVCFLTAEFPVQFLTKRYGFKRVLPTVRGPEAPQEIECTANSTFLPSSCVAGA